MVFKKGELNPKWNNGTSEYPNHALMKRNRKIVLKGANYICEYCGGKANQIHHKDLSKGNHSIENLAPCCHKCNHQRKVAYTSKFKRLYGKSGKEIAQIFKVAPSTITRWYREGKLPTVLPSTPIE